LIRLARRRATGVDAAVLVCVLIASACAGTSGDGVGDASTVTYAVADFENDSLDPAMESNTGVRAAKYLMWDSLLEIGPDGELAPGIAESWSMAEDGQSWTFKLRQGVQFHNGEALTADDVKFSLDRLRHEDAAADNYAALAREQIATVEVVDDYAVRVNTNGVQTTLPYLVSSHQSTIGIVLPHDYLLENGGESFEGQRKVLEEAPIGSGPFRFVSRVAGDSMTFEAVPNHWRHTPEIQRVEILRVTEEATQVSMLQSGEVDIINVSPDQAETLQGAGFDIRTVPNATEIGIFFPGTWRDGAAAEPVGDVTVRKALSLAIDRKTIIDTVLAGYAGLKTTPWNTIPVTADIHEPDWSDWARQANEYDPKRARQLLAEAGYPNGFGGLQMFAFSRPGITGLPQIAEIVAAQWAEIGVEAKIVPTDYNSYSPHWLRASADDSYNRGDTNPFGTAPRFDPIGAFAAYVMYDGGAVQLTRDAELDALVQEAAGTTDDEQRQDLIKQAFAKFLDEWVVLEIAIADSVYAVNPDEVGEWRTIPSYPFLGRMFETIKAP
jgi:peptide/nickel transport system substrate-binding protein